MKILWILFWDHYNIDLDLEVISMHFKVKVQNGLYFWGMLEFHILDIIGGWKVGPSLRMI